MHCAALPRQVHLPPPTSNLITRCQPEVEVASTQATTRRRFLPTKMQESQAIPALLHHGGAVGSQFPFPIRLQPLGEEPSLVAPFMSLAAELPLPPRLRLRQVLAPAA